jgi:cytochrome c
MCAGVWVTGVCVAAIAWTAAAFQVSHAALAQPVSPPRPAPVSTEQVGRGQTIFASICATCHGAQGQGGKGPRIIGQPNGLSGYPTAKELYEFVSTQMPFDNAGSLKVEEYWDVLAFVLDENRLLPPDTTLGPDNASMIKLAP